jgi:diguanylate cyclase
MLLRELAQVIGEAMRGSDFIFRYGGDELLLVLPDTSHEQLIKKAESLRSLVADFSCKTNEGATIAVTLSIGAATYPEHGDSQKSLIESADNAVYLAKDGGRNQVRSASEVMEGE